MAQMIKVTKKIYNDDNLVDKYFIINVDNINFIEDSDRDSWEESIILMCNGDNIDTLETKEELFKLINSKN